MPAVNRAGWCDWALAQPDDVATGYGVVKHAKAGTKSCEGCKAARRRWLADKREAKRTGSALAPQAAC